MHWHEMDGHCRLLFLEFVVCNFCFAARFSVTECGVRSSAHTVHLSGKHLRKFNGNSEYDHRKVYAYTLMLTKNSLLLLDAQTSSNAHFMSRKPVGNLTAVERMPNLGILQKGQ